jgi:hypothetical protein
MRISRVRHAVLAPKSFIHRCLRTPFVKRFFPLSSPTAGENAGVPRQNGVPIDEDRPLLHQTPLLRLFVTFALPLARTTWPLQMTLPYLGSATRPERSRQYEAQPDSKASAA